MFGLHRETATAVANGKVRNAVARGAQIKQELKTIIDELVRSQFDADQLQEILGGTGIAVPLPTIQNILSRRWGRGA